MTFRGGPLTAAERIADLEEQVRRMQASAASTLIVTDYSALSGKPTDLATLADLAAVQAAAQAALDDAAVWTWVEVAP